jgi:cell wall-associated NlpC family hydrolase
LPHSSRGQSDMGTPVARADLQPGDLVFFYEPISHVGIYVGDGQMVDAGNEETGVSERPVDMEGYNVARRIA